MNYDQCLPHEFIELLFSGVPSGFVEVTYLTPPGLKLYPRTVVQWAELPLHPLDPELPAIHAMNKRGYSCYFAPAVRSKMYPPQQAMNKQGRPYTYYPRGKAVDAAYVTALWVDVDDPDKAVIQRLFQSLIMPSIVVATGGGYHAYWLLEKPLMITDQNRADVVRTLKGLALYHQGDSKVADLARVMRLPGTINTKPERGGALCEVIDIIPGAYYYADLELAYAPLIRPDIPAPTRPLAIPADKHLPSWIDTYLKTGEAQGNRNKRLYSVARRLLDNGFTAGEVEAVLLPRGMADGLSESEAIATLHSAERAPRGAPDMPYHMQTRMGTTDKRLRS